MKFTDYLIMRSHQFLNSQGESFNVGSYVSQAILANSERVVIHDLLASQRHIVYETV